jgi:hypothetical protein
VVQEGDKIRHVSYEEIDDFVAKQNPPKEVEIMRRKEN